VRLHALVNPIEESMRKRLVSASGLVLGALLIPTAAYGQRSADAARAEALFAEGRRLMAGRDYAAACPKFADSQALDPAPGTALNLATCYERAGKLASAWATFKTAQASAESAGQRDRAAAAKKKVANLEPRLSRLTIVVAPASRATELEVRCDQEPVRQGEWGVSVPRDGGGHDVEARAPGKKTWTSHVDLKDSGQSLEVQVPALEDAPAPVASASSASPAAGSETPPPAQGSHVLTEERGDRGRAQRVVGLGVGGLGIAGLALGAIAGFEASSSYSNAKNACGPSAPQCSAGSPAFGQRDVAVTWATASTIGFAAGGAVLVAGAVLFFTAPKGDSGPSVGVSPAGVSLQGTF
jgi:hypothetical protein